MGLIGLIGLNRGKIRTEGIVFNQVANPPNLSTLSKHIIDPSHATVKSRLTIRAACRAPFHFWFHSFTSGLSHSHLPPILISQARLASSIGGNTHPQAAPVLLCSQPICLKKLPNSVSVTYLALALCSTASSNSLFDKTHLGFFI